MRAYWTFGEGTTADRRIIRMVQAESQADAWELLGIGEWVGGVCPISDLSTPALLAILREKPPGEVVEVDWHETPTAYDRFRGASLEEYQAAEDEGYDFT